MEFRCFNSKLVRLKVTNITAFRHFILAFQFQTGSIKREFGATHKNPVTYVSIPNWFD